MEENEEKSRFGNVPPASAVAVLVLVVTMAVLPLVLLACDSSPVSSRSVGCAVGAGVTVAAAAALSPSRGFFELFVTHLSIGPQPPAQSLLRFAIEVLATECCTIDALVFF